MTSQDHVGSLRGRYWFRSLCFPLKMRKMHVRAFPSLHLLGKQNVEVGSNQLGNSAHFNCWEYFVCWVFASYVSVQESKSFKSFKSWINFFLRFPELQRVRHICFCHATRGQAVEHIRLDVPSQVDLLTTATQNLLTWKRHELTTTAKPIVSQCLSASQILAPREDAVPQADVQRTWVTQGYQWVICHHNSEDITWPFQNAVWDELMKFTKFMKLKKALAN